MNSEESSAEVHSPSTLLEICYQACFKQSVFEEMSSNSEQTFRIHLLRTFRSLQSAIRTLDSVLAEIRTLRSARSSSVNSSQSDSAPSEQSSCNLPSEEHGSSCKLASVERSPPCTVTTVEHSSQKPSNSTESNHDHNNGLIDNPSYGTTRPVDIANFKYVRKLGAGAYGQVFLVYDPKTKENFAIKTVRATRGAYYAGKYVEARIEKEIMTKMIGKPFVSQLYFTTVTEDKLLYCMKFYSGGSLQDVINILETSDQKLSYRDAQLYVAEILAAVKMLHKKYVLHRDLRPDNILFDEDGHVVLIDFGLSMFFNKDKPVEEHVSRDNYLDQEGNEYLAPEMIYSEGHSYPADLYSVGVTIRKLCADRNLDKNWSQEDKQKFSNLIGQLTEADCRKRPSIKEVTKHPVFKGIRWSEVMERNVVMPRFTANVGQQPCSDQAVQLEDVIGNVTKPRKINGCLRQFSTYKLYEETISQQSGDHE